MTEVPPRIPDENTKRADRLVSRRWWYRSLAEFTLAVAGAALFCIWAVYVDKRQYAEGVREMMMATCAVAGVAVFLLSWFFRRCAKKLEPLIPLVNFGATEEEAKTVAATEVDGDTRGTRAGELAEEYYLKNKTDVDALEARFMRVMTEQYRFRPEVAQAMMYRMVNGKQFHTASVWLQEGLSVEKLAKEAYDGVARTVNRSNPKVFTHDATTGQEIPEGHQPSVTNWMLFGTDSPGGSHKLTLAVMTAIVVLGLMAALFSPYFMVSSGWRMASALIALAASAALVCWSIHAQRTGKMLPRPGRKPPGIAFGTLMVAGFALIFWMALCWGLGGGLTYMFGAEAREIVGAYKPKTQSRKVTYKKRCFVIEASSTKLCFATDVYDGMPQWLPMRITGKKAWFGFLISGYSPAR